MAALLAVGAAPRSAACASGTLGRRRRRATRARPSRAARSRFPLPGEPLSIEPLNAQDASGLQVAHQVFQGLTRWVLNDDGVLDDRAGHRGEVGDHRRPDVGLPPQDRGDVPVAGRPSGHRPGLRRFVDPGHRSAEPVLRGVHPGAHRGLRRPRLPDRPGAGAHRRQGARRPDAPGHASLPVRRLPRDAGPSGRRGRPRRLHRPGRRQGLRPEAGGHRPLRWSSRGSADARSRSSGTRVLGRRASRLRRRGRPAHLRRRRGHVDRLPGG